MARERLFKWSQPTWPSRPNNCKIGFIANIGGRRAPRSEPSPHGRPKNRSTGLQKSHWRPRRFPSCSCERLPCPKALCFAESVSPGRSVGPWGFAMCLSQGSRNEAVRQKQRNSGFLQPIPPTHSLATLPAPSGHRPTHLLPTIPHPSKSSCSESPNKERTHLPALTLAQKVHIGRESGIRMRISISCREDSAVAEICQSWSAIDQH